VTPRRPSKNYVKEWTEFGGEDREGFSGGDDDGNSDWGSSDAIGSCQGKKEAKKVRKHWALQLGTKKMDEGLIK